MLRRTMPIPGWQPVRAGGLRGRVSRHFRRAIAESGNDGSEAAAKQPDRRAGRSLGEAGANQLPFYGNGITSGAGAARTRPHIRHPRRRVTQHSRDAEDRTEKPRRTGSPAFAKDDSGAWNGVFPYHCEERSDDLSAVGRTAKAEAIHPSSRTLSYTALCFNPHPSTAFETEISCQTTPYA